MIVQIIKILIASLSSANKLQVTSTLSGVYADRLGLGCPYILLLKFNFLNRAFFVCSCLLKRTSRGRARLAYKNRLTKTLIITLLFCRKLYGARWKFDKIPINTNSLLENQMLSHLRHYFKTFFCPVIKRRDMCGANV